MRQRQFGEYLLRLGDGREPTNIDLGEDFIWMPDNMLYPHQNLENLTAAINDMTLQSFPGGEALLVAHMTA